MRVWICLFAGLAGCTTAGPDTDFPAPDTDTDRVDTDVADSDPADTDLDTGAPPDPGTDFDPTDRPGPARFDEEAAGRGLIRSQSSGDEPQPCNHSEVHAGGGAVGDVDGDGDVDIFQAAFGGESTLYLNRGNGTFFDATAWSGLRVAGHASGAALVDLEGDGDLDLTVGFLDEGFLQQWINLGNGQFVESATSLGLTPPGPEHRGCPMIWGLAWGDPDRDADLDLLMGTWDAAVRPHPATQNAYFRQDAGRFRDVAGEVGLTTPKTWTFSPGWADLDGDGWPDQALTSDFLSNRLYLGSSAGTFREVGGTRGVADVENGMGSQLVDLDDDGDLDWLITSIFDERQQRPGGWGGSGNRLYLNDGAGWFTDGTDAAGLRQSGWAWGVVAFDADNDGDREVAITNGHTLPDGGAHLAEAFVADPTQLWFRGDDGRFVDRAAELGVSHTGQGRGLVHLDVEGDGDLDLLLFQYAGPPNLWINRLRTRNHWLRVRLSQDGGNRDGLGSTVWITRSPGEAERREEVHANPTYLTTGPAEAHFGLGPSSAPVDRLRVVWPDGTTTTLRDVAADQVLTIRR